MSAVSYKCGSSVLANELFKIHQAKMWLWVTKWMKAVLVVSTDGMWCLRGLVHVSKGTLHQRVCCSPLYQMLRRKNAILKNPGVGRIHHRQYPQWVVKELSHRWCSVGLQCVEEVRMRPSCTLEPESPTTKLSLTQGIVVFLGILFYYGGIFFAWFSKEKKHMWCYSVCTYMWILTSA